MTRTTQDTAGQSRTEVYMKVYVVIAYDYGDINIDSVWVDPAEVEAYINMKNAQNTPDYTLEWSFVERTLNNWKQRTGDEPI